MKFAPKFTITAQIAEYLIRIEALKKDIVHLPISPTMVAHLRDTARVESAHYSTKIEGNRLTLEQVNDVIAHKKHFPGKERDEREIKGFYVALDHMEKIATSGGTEISEADIKTLHALVMGEGKLRVQQTPFRDGQNVIREGSTGRIVYLPPESKDVPELMHALVEWINDNVSLVPIAAAIAHYQFATIHPYYDGNGRTARLLATLILRQRGYDLKGICSLDGYYANDLMSYYNHLTVGPSNNYYEGRAEADLTEWVTYFCKGVVESFEAVAAQAKELASRGV